jgi:hypothetical protein
MTDLLVLSVLFALVVLGLRPARRAGAKRAGVAAQQPLVPWVERARPPRGPVAGARRASAA